MKEEEKNQKIIGLDFLIIFAGGVFFLMHQWSATFLQLAIFFVLCFFYLWISRRGWPADKKAAAALLIIIFTIGYPLKINMEQRRDYQRPLPHDNILQVEPAIKFLLAGKNPYRENYFGTELEGARYIYLTARGQVEEILNPALYHLIKLPWHILCSVPFYLASNYLLGFFDQRIVYLALFAASLWLLYRLPHKGDEGIALAAAYAFNPLFTNFFAEGRDDVFVLFWLIATFYLLKKNKIRASAATLALAATSKHSAWFFLPFYYIYVYGMMPGINLSWLERIKKTFSQTWPLPVLCAAIILPFFFWDAGAFWADIYSYPAGTIATSYPINGYGLSMVLYDLGLVRKLRDYLPLFIVQIPLTLFIFWRLGKKQLGRNTIGRAIAYYGLTIFVYLFLSRFFNDNYIGFILQLMIIACFLENKEIKKEQCPTV